MAAAADIEILQPVPFLHGIRPMPAWARASQHDVDGIKIQHQPMFYLPGAMKSLDGHWLARSILPRIRAFHDVRKVDLVDAHFGYPDGVGAVLAARRLRLPVFVTIRGLEAERVSRPLIRRQLIAALNASTGCISVSHSLRDLMVQNGVDPDRIEVVPNAVDRGTFRPGSQEEARRSLGLPVDAGLVVTVGHLIARKRHNVLIEAVARLRDRGSKATLAIVGGTDHEPACPDALHRLVDKLEMSTRIRFVGAVPPKEISSWLRAADVFALVTASEGCCNAILEALASGKPVVTTRSGDNSHYVKDGENGYFVPIDDPESTAVALEKALRANWDSDTISSSLPVGTWTSVAEDVLTFFQTRLDIESRCAAGI